MSKDVVKLQPSAQTELESLVRRIRRMARADTPCSDIASYEIEVAELVHQVGAMLMAQELSRHEPSSDTVLIDDVTYRRVVEGEGRYMTIFGPVMVSRGRYRAVRNGPTVAPLELKLGIVEGFWTPKAAKAAALAVTDLTPRRAEALFQEIGVLPASRSSFDRLPKALGARWESRRGYYEGAVLASDEIPASATTVAISCDGVMVTMNSDTNTKQHKANRRKNGQRDSGPTGQREATVGSLSFYDAEGQRLLTRRVGRMPESRQRTLQEILRVELAAVRQRRPDLRVVAVADGARGVWNFLHDLGADVEVVDFYHATNRLKDALNELMGATSKETHARFEELRHILRNETDGVDQVIVALEEYELPLKQRRRRVFRGAQYFRRHRERMHYAKLDADHIPIGSGVIEGTCKSVVSDRLKRSGMRWSEPGGQAILTFRALAQCGRFDRAWVLLHETYISNINEQTLALAA